MSCFERFASHPSNAAQVSQPELGSGRRNVINGRPKLETRKEAGNDRTWALAVARAVSQVR